MAENRQIGSVFAHLWNSRSKLGKKINALQFSFFLVFSL